MDNPLEPRNAGNKSNDDSELTEINEWVMITITKKLRILYLEQQRNYGILSLVPLENKVVCDLYLKLFGKNNEVLAVLLSHLDELLIVGKRYRSGTKDTTHNTTNPSFELPISYSDQILYQK